MFIDRKSFLLLVICIVTVHQGYAKFNILSDLKYFELVTPKLIQQPSLQQNQETFPNDIQYEFYAFETKFQLKLQKNHELFRNDYVEIRYSEDKIVRNTDVASTKCHYIGQSIHHPESRVTLSTCNGVKGLVYLGDASYFIEPAHAYESELKEKRLQSGSTDSHLIYRLQDVNNPASRCPVTGTTDAHMHHLQHRDEGFFDLLAEHLPKNNVENHEDSMDTKKHQRGLKQTQSTIYVELLFVNDYARYQSLGSTTETDAASLINTMNSIYYLGGFVPTVQIALVGQVTFSEGDPYNSSAMTSAGQTDETQLLNTFNSWRSSTSSLPQHDNGILLSGLHFQGTIVGLADIGTMCNFPYSGAVVSAIYSDMYTALVASHEMGHNFGMQHDGTLNSCPTTGYVMEPVSCTSCGLVNFSSCSVTFFTTWYSSTSHCLLNVPPTTTYAPRCGDGIVNGGEQCDCGVACSADPCCNGSTCTFATHAPTGVAAGNSIYPAVCSDSDPCCSQCQLVPHSAQQVCRQSIGVCDSSEVCSGVSSKCPGDDYVTAGTSCMSGNISGACYQGSCVSYESACQALQSTFSSLAPLHACPYQDQFSSACGTLYCASGTSTSTCYYFTNPSTVTVPNGVVCASGSQCSGGSCVASSSLSSPLTYGYQTTPFSSCSVTCGSGVQTRSVFCVDSNGNVVSNSLCSASTPPASSQSCSVSCGTTPTPTVTTSWVTGTFSPCSATCGTGTQARSVVCQNSAGTVVSNSQCTSSMPSTIQSCSAPACLTTSWVTGAFSPCSATCGTGTQARSVTCQNSAGTVVSNSQCTSSMPSTIQSCSAPACPTASWVTGAFSPCSATCGTGTQVRSVTCQTSTGTVVSNSACTTAVPASSQSCIVAACSITGTWATGPWSTCPSSCTGTMTRSVTCVIGNMVVVPSYCNASTQPASSQSCFNSLNC